MMRSHAARSSAVAAAAHGATARSSAPPVHGAPELLPLTRSPDDEAGFASAGALAATRFSFADLPIYPKRNAAPGPSLLVSGSDDPLEREADRAADAIASAT
jgi:hypothetical protein